MYNGIFDPALTGVLSVPTRTGIDPATAGVLSMGLGLLGTNGGPRAAGSFGNALGQAGMQGLQSYAVADQQRRENQRADALVALERAKTMSTLQQAALAKAANERQQQFWAQIQAAMAGQGQQGAPGVAPPQPQAQYNAGIGQFVSSPAPPPQTQAAAAPGNRFGLNPAMVLAGKGAGVDLVDLYKAGQRKMEVTPSGVAYDPSEVAPGTTFPIMSPATGLTGQIMPQPGGGYRHITIPGSLESVRDAAEAKARGEAGYTLREVGGASATSPPTLQSVRSIVDSGAGGPLPVGTSPGVPPVRVTADTPEQAAALYAQEAAKAGIRYQGTPQVPAGVPSGMSKEDEARQAARAEQMKHTAKAFSDQFTSMQNARMQNPAKIANIGRIDKLLEGFEGGKLSGFGFELARLGNSLNLKIDDKLPAKEQAEALSKELALQLRQTGEGSGMPGALSDSDREFLRQMTPQMGQSAAGRKGMVEAKVALLQREMKVADLALQYRAKHGALDDNFFIQLNQWVDSNPLFKK